MRTEPLDAATVTADQVAAVHAVEVAALAADEPDRPPHAAEDTGAVIRVARDDSDTLRWLVTDGAEPVGTAWLMLPRRDNTHTGFADVVVTPARRRQGVGSALLRTVVGELHREGRRSFLIEAHGGTPGAAFCDAYGLEEAQSDRSSVLRLADADRDRLDAWADAGHPGYRLVAWAGRCPDDLLVSYAAAKNAMNDAPTGTMDWEGVTYPPEDLRDEEETQRARNREFRVVAAVEEKTGDIAGFTELMISNWSPARATTEDTAVVPAHRGHGLGLWVKAEMLRRVIAERPDVRETVTRNGLTNPHMWEINEKLGFRPHATTVERQGDVAALAGRFGL